MPSYNIPVSVEFEFEILCDRCGRDLDYEEKTNVHGNTVYNVEPCSRCEDVIQQEAYDAGYDSGNSDGYKSGHVDGYEEGQQSMEPKDPL